MRRGIVVLAEGGKVGTCTVAPSRPVFSFLPLSSLGLLPPPNTSTAELLSFNHLGLYVAVYSPPSCTVHVSSSPPVRKHHIPRTPSPTDRISDACTDGGGGGTGYGGSGACSRTGFWERLPGPLQVAYGILQNMFSCDHSPLGLVSLAHSFTCRGHPRFVPEVIMSSENDPQRISKFDSSLLRCFCGQQPLKNLQLAKKGLKDAV